MAKQLQGAFGELFRRTRRAMLLVDDDQRYVAANEPACRLLGLSSDELVGQTITEVTPPELRDQVPAMWERFLTEGTLEGPYELVRSDGKRIEVTFSATANVLRGLHLAMLVRVDAHEYEESPAGGERSVSPISRRERDVLRIVALGHTNAEAGEQLGISPETVRNHIRNARDRLGARTKAHAIALAFQQGLFEDVLEKRY